MVAQEGNCKVIGKGIVVPGKFGDTNMRKVGITNIPFLSQAIFDMAADGLPLGALPAWGSMSSDKVLRSPGTAGQSPNVIMDGTVPCVKFDGVLQRMDMDVAEGQQPLTILMVARYHTTAGALAATSGGTGTSWQLGTYAAGDRWLGAFGESNLSVSTPIPDGGWHVHALTINGAGNSSYKLDNNAPVAGTLGTGDLSHVRLGASAGAYSNVSIARIAAVRNMSAAQIAQVVTEWKLHYGI